MKSSKKDFSIKPIKKNYCAKHPFEELKPSFIFLYCDKCTPTKTLQPIKTKNGWDDLLPLGMEFVYDKSPNMADILDCARHNNFTMCSYDVLILIDNRSYLDVDIIWNRFHQLNFQGSKLGKHPIKYNDWTDLYHKSAAYFNERIVCLKQKPK